MSDVFISYARANERSARRVADAIRSRGIEVWSDDQLPAHRAYSEIIEQRLEQAKAVVVLWSKEAAQSQWVRAEADYARNAGKLVQAQLDDQLPPMPFNQIQCASLKGWRGSEAHPGWSKLVASVGELVSAPAPQQTASAGDGKRPGPRRWWIAAAAAAALLIAALLIVPRLLDRGEAERPVLAVLPFESLDQRDASLVAGIWEDTRHAISRNPQLLVLGPNTAEELAGRGTDAIRRAADYVLEASVRSAGGRIRVNTNLVRTKDGAQLWSENFDRKLDDVFALQSEIAGAIEGRIRGRLAQSGGVQPEHIATSGEVYALYSDARAKIRKRQMRRYQEARIQLEEVVERDPNFAPGWATLAVAKVISGTGGPDLAAEADARRAIALAPNLAAGHAALGFSLDRKGPAAKSALRRALQLDPNDIEAMNWLAGALSQEGDHQAAFQLYNRILEIEPLWWPAIVNKVKNLKQTGRLADADKEIARLERLGDAFSAMLIKMDVAGRNGDISRTVDLGLQYYRRAPPQQRAAIGTLLFTPLAQLQMFDALDRVFPPPSPWIGHIRRNDPRGIDMFEAELKPKQFWTFGELGIVGARLYLLSNQAPRLARQYHAAAASPEEFMKLVGTDRIADVAPSAALALKRAGEEPEAGRLLELAAAHWRDSFETEEDAEVRLARIYAVQGRKDEAIARLLGAVRRGWLPPYLPIHVDLALDPPLAELKGDPRFERVRQQILDHLAKERAEVGPVKLD